MALPPEQLGCEPTESAEGFRFREPPEHTYIAAVEIHVGAALM